jgi:hypothetical protein
MARTNLKDRFFSKVFKNSKTGCWEWTAQKDKDGYGRISFCCKPHLAHRISFEIHHGEIPGGMMVLHRCDNRPCVNPDHLFLGDHLSNMADMALKGRSPSGAYHHRPCAVLTEKDVLEIKSAKGVTQRTLAAQYGVGQDQISRIRTGKRWSYL